MLSLSIDKKLDYSTPIYFVPLGIVTTNIKTTTPIKKSTPTPPIKKTDNKQTATVTQKKIDTKPITTAATPPKKPEPAKQEIVKTKQKIEPSSSAKATADTSAKTDVKEEIKKEVTKIEPKKITPVVEQPKQIPTKNIPIAQAIDTEQEIIPVIPDNAHISHNYREVEALRKQAQLQKELVQTWKPPIGVSPDCACEISFFVNSTGKIENIKMVKNSGVMMFDISVRQALFAMKMPQWTYGKPFTINFK
jgi:hypothetical protein